MKLDSVDVAILKELMDDGRASYASIAKKLELPTPTVNFRVKRMEQNGLITGFTIYTDCLINSSTKNVVALLIKAKPFKIKEIKTLFKTKLESINDKKELIQSFWECIGDYNLIAYVFADHALDISKIIHLLKNSPDIIAYKIGNPLKEYFPFNKTFIKQLSKIVNDNG